MTIMYIALCVLPTLFLLFFCIDVMDPKSSPGLFLCDDSIRNKALDPAGTQITTILPYHCLFRVMGAGVYPVEFGD